MENTPVPSTSSALTKPTGTPANSPFEINIYQIAADDLFRGHRPDGTGWDWSWANWKRDWMDESMNKFAYRCLPLTIANQTGWWVYNPVGFTAIWDGRPGAGGVGIMFDTGQHVWSTWINNQFGLGTITWNTPFLFRTKPEGSRLLVTGPVNYFKHGVQALTAIIESDWMSMSFTMNWKITCPRIPIRFDQGEPLFQVIPMAGNICTDLETARVKYMRLAEDPEISEAYMKWHHARSDFHRKKAAGEVPPDGWQKDYFQGRDMLGREVTSGHKTKLTPPVIDYKSAKP